MNLPAFTRITRPHISADAASSTHLTVGGQWEWDWAIPLTYRAMQAPSTGAPMPARPTRDTNALDAAGYWNALQHLLSYSLGWARHDRGLRWWYNNGKPTDDLRLKLLDAVWEADGLLERYTAFAHSESASTSVAFGARGIGSDVLSDAWRRRIEQWSEVGHGGDSPWEKHLPQHGGGPLEGEGGHPVLLRDDASRRAVLMCEWAEGWLTALRVLGSRLHEHRHDDWKIDVVVTPIGHLGTYRKSWETNMWFSGPHRLHAVGN